MEKIKKLQDICYEFGVEDIYELDRLNLEHDQRAIKEGLFDED